MKSKFFKLNAQDFIRGLVVSVLSSVVTIMYQTVQEGSLVFDWKAIGTVALMSSLGYIMKNLMTNSEDKMFTSEPPSNP